VVVLLVDGAHGVRARLREHIAREGIIVLEAGDAADADAALSRTSVDVILLDVHVRAENGLRLLSQLRKRAPAATLIVLTNEANDVHRRECLKQGADYFLDKSREFDAAVELVVARAS